LTDQVASQAAISKAARRRAEPERLKLGRNFLHAARLEFPHPKTGKVLSLEAPLPVELVEFLARLEEGNPAPAEQTNKAVAPRKGSVAKMVKL
jgi:23S rRNA pseudouridine1911/1915/1917 synthase